MAEPTVCSAGLDFLWPRLGETPRQLGLYRDRSPERVIVLYTAETGSDRRREILHHILQNTQLRTIAVLQEHFLPPVMIEIREGECPSILEKIQPWGAGNIGKRSIPVVRVEDIPLEPAPGAFQPCL